MLWKRDRERGAMDHQHRILPFYMSCSMPYFMREEDRVMQDLEYLQQMYPAQAKRIQKKIAEILDRIDYEGSMLYDEYPDRQRLYGLGESIVTILKQEEEEEGIDGASPQKWEWMRDMVQILLYGEIYKRRHAGRRCSLKF